MAKGKKTGGRDFKKGSSGNPRGGAAHNQELKAVRRMSQTDVAEVGRLILEGNLGKLQAVKDDHDASVLKVWFCSVAIKAISRGDAHALSVILDRIVGKVPAEMNLTGTLEQNHTVASTSQVKAILMKLEDEY